MSLIKKEGGVIVVKNSNKNKTIMLVLILFLFIIFNITFVSAQCPASLDYNGRRVTLWMCTDNCPVDCVPPGAYCEADSDINP